MITEHGLGILIVGLTMAALGVAVGPAALRRALGRLIPVLDPRRFACRVLLFEEQTPAGCTDVLKIQVQGTIRAPHPGCESELRIQLMDATDKSCSSRPVLCRRPEWSADGSPAYEYTLQNGLLPARVSVLKDWVTIAEVGVEELIFPRRGPAILECTVCVLEKATGKRLTCARGQISLLSERYGYEEIQYQRTTKQNAMRQMAVGFCQLTAPNPAGQELLESWLREQRLPSAKPTGPDAVDFQTAASSIEEACEQLAGSADPAECFHIFELCVRISASASFLPAPFLKLLQQTAGKLEIPREQFDSLVEKYLAGRAELIEDPLALLGLTEQMSESEILQKLTAEYRKWNGRVTHADPAIRQKADRMLNLIAQCRSRLTRQGSAGGNVPS